MRSCSAEGSHLIAGFRCPNNTCNGVVSLFTLNGYAHDSGSGCQSQPTYAVEDTAGQFWYADENPGIRVAETEYHPCQPLTFNTPYSDKVSELAVQDGTLFVATGGVSDSYNALGRKDGFLIRKQGEWSYYNYLNYPELGIAEAQDYFRILPHPDHSLFEDGR